MNPTLNLDLVSVGCTVAGILVIASIIYFNNWRSITATTFLSFSIITALWSIANYFQYQITDPVLGLWMVRIITFLGCWHALLFFQLCYVFPSEAKAFPRTYKTLLLPITFVTSVLTLTPLVFDRVSATSSAGVVTQIDNGPGIILFLLLVISYIGSGLYELIKKAWHARGRERTQFFLIGGGMLATFILIVIFNIVLPSLFNISRFLPLSALFVFPLNVRVVGAELFSFALCVATLVQVAFSETALELVFRSSAFLLVLAVSILFVKSVIKEIEQRALIEAQERELEVANAQQTNLLHFISHEIKGYLTKNQAAFAAITEGDYGTISPKLTHMADLALADTRQGVATVMQILDASNLKKGTMLYARDRFDLYETVQLCVRELQALAKERGLRLTFSATPGKYDIVGDRDKIAKHVLRNLIDNAIRYTLQGYVTVSLERRGSSIRFSVADTGVGIDPGDMHTLFTEGGRGKDSTKINVHSTGYGLFIAKSIVTAHGGRIWAESAGKGKGSTFHVEVDAAA